MLKDIFCDVFFLGSFFINLWDNIYWDMVLLKIFWCLYGGVVFWDMFYNYDVIVWGYYFCSIVIYVENDFVGIFEDLIVGEIFDFFCLLINCL